MNKLYKIVITALFAALACVATMIIKVPTVGTNGYVNIGDSIVLLCAWLIGGVYGGLAAGIGPALADLISGYPSYVLGTLVIKFLMGVAAYAVFKIVKKFNKIVAYVVSSIVAEIIMVFGYFIYENFLLGYGMAAAASIPSNAIQGITCIVIGLVLVVALDAAKVTTYLKKIV